jgi:hypothetical protein
MTSRAINQIIPNPILLCENQNIRTNAINKYKAANNNNERCDAIRLCVMENKRIAVHKEEEKRLKLLEEYRFFKNNQSFLEKLHFEGEEHFDNEETERGDVRHDTVNRLSNFSTTFEKRDGKKLKTVEERPEYNESVNHYINR